MALLSQWRIPSAFKTDDNYDYSTFNQIQENFLYLFNRPFVRKTAVGTSLSNVTIDITPSREPTGYWQTSLTTLTGNFVVFGQMQIQSVGNRYIYMRMAISDGIRERYIGAEENSGSIPVVSSYYSRDVDATHTMQFMLPVVGRPAGTYTVEPEFYLSANDLGTGIWYPSNLNNFIAVMEV